MPIGISECAQSVSHRNTASMENCTVAFGIVAKTLKILVATLKELTDEINIGFYAEGIKISTMDSAHISLIDCRIRAENLPFYHCQRNLVLGIQIDPLHMVLSHAKNDCELTLSKPPDAEALEIVTKHTGNLARTATSRIPLIDIEAPAYEEEKHDYTAEMLFESQDFREIITELYSMGDKVVIVLQPPTYICFRLGGAIADQGHENVLHPEASEKLGLKLSGPVHAEFALSYLVKFCKAADFKESVMVQLQTDQPGIFEFAFAEGFIRFYLAPQIHDD